MREKNIVLFLNKINSAKFTNAGIFYNCQNEHVKFHFLLHNHTAHMSTILKLSRRFATQGNLYIMLKI
jgi:hypothetical protein